jgi:hypothetical protein
VRGARESERPHPSALALHRHRGSSQVRRLSCGGAPTAARSAPRGDRYIIGARNEAQAYRTGLAAWPGSEC